jgi:hypothetical protein
MCRLGGVRHTAPNSRLKIRAVFFGYYAGNDTMLVEYLHTTSPPTHPTSD